MRANAKKGSHRINLAEAAHKTRDTIDIFVDTVLDRAIALNVSIVDVITTSPPTPS